MDSDLARPPTGYLPYGERKPYVVAHSLAALTGPTRGVVSLPRHLDWSGRAEYDLSRPARLASMYKVVLSEAGSVDDLCAWLDGGLLRRLWPTLWRLREFGLSTDLRRWPQRRQEALDLLRTRATCGDAGNAWNVGEIYLCVLLSDDWEMALALCSRD